MKITLSQHAIEQARERGVTIDQIKRVIQRGAKYLQGKKVIADYTYLRVVYKMHQGEYFIITIMIKKGETK